jgi:hypothetical protein
MGSHVGAIASAVGGRNITLSHVGTAFPITADNMRRWSGWWRYILTDQVFIWAPGCFMGMALPALMSIEFAQYSDMKQTGLAWAQAIVTADGMRLAPEMTPALRQILWVMALLAGMAVMLPSQMSIVDDFSRRWTDGIWTASRRGQMDLLRHSGVLCGVVIVLDFCFQYLGHPETDDHCHRKSEQSGHWRDIAAAALHQPSTASA